MYRFIAHVLIWCVVSGNFAWATDYVEAMDPHDSQPEQVLLSDSENTNSADLCDHCCHGNAHFLGVFSSNIDTISLYPNNYRAIPATLVTSVTFQPPTPPPNA